MLRSISRPKQSGESVESVRQTGDVDASTADNPRRTPARGEARVSCLGGLEPPKPPLALPLTPASLFVFFLFFCLVNKPFIEFLLVVCLVRVQLKRTYVTFLETLVTIINGYCCESSTHVQECCLLKSTTTYRLVLM